MSEACARDLIRRCLLLDVCSYCAYRNLSISVARKGLLVACRDLPITTFLSNSWDLATMRKLNTDTHAYCTKFGIVTF